jgi:hypothetical protein
VLNARQTFDKWHARDPQSFCRWISLSWGRQ